MFLGSLGSSAAFPAVMNMVFLLFSVLIAWYALKVVRWDVFLKDPKSRPAAVLRLLVAILLGHALASFLNEYLMASMMLR
ncbi:MAG: DUF1146 family protein [Tumebacillaceae bacterium]